MEIELFKLQTILILISNFIFLAQLTINFMGQEIMELKILP